MVLVVLSKFVGSVTQIKSNLGPRLRLANRARSCEFVRTSKIGMSSSRLTAFISSWRWRSTIKADVPNPKWFRRHFMMVVMFFVWIQVAQFLGLQTWMYGDFKGSGNEKGNWILARNFLYVYFWRCFPHL